MMGRQSRQMAMIFVDMESLIPENHLLHIPDQTRQLHGENPPVRRRKSASPPEVSASNRLCQPQGLAERKISRRTRG